MEELSRIWAENSDNIIMFTIIGVFLFKGSIMAMIFGIKNSSVSDLQSLLSKSNQVILDVRTEPEYLSGHISEAINVPLDQISETNAEVSKLDKTKPVYVICASGNRSLSAALKLKKLGFDVTNIRGGMAFWQLKKLPVV